MMSTMQISAKPLAFLSLTLANCAATLNDDFGDFNTKRQHHDDHREQLEHHPHYNGQMTTATSEDRVTQCGIYLAPSSIPGSGLGMYAGNRTFDVNEIVTDEDIVIPIFEREWHSNVKGKFLWDEYIWNGDVSLFLVSAVVWIMGRKLYLIIIFDLVQIHHW
jgi:hypothetical protein